MKRILLATTALCLSAFAQPANALRFVDRTVALGFPNTPTITQGENPVADYNNDGLPDLIEDNHNLTRWWVRLQQPNGSFVRSNLIPETKYDLHGGEVCDLVSPNGGPDGRPDLFFSVGADGGQPGDPNPRKFFKRLWVAKADGGYVDQGKLHGLDILVNDRMRAARCLDADGDGDNDLATAAVGSPTKPSLNRLLINNGGRFTELSGAAYPARNRPPFAGSECMAVVPRAGGDDVIYCRVKNGGLAYFRNNGNKTFSLSQKEFSGQNARKIVVRDLNSDGKPDVALITSTQLQVHLNTGGNNFARSYSLPVTQGWVVAACNLDPGGKVDLFVMQGKDPHEAAPNRQDFALMSEGTGRAFNRVNVGPATSPGNDDSASCIEDYRGSGYALLQLDKGRWLLKGPTKVYVAAP